jgi:plasmid stabilization system protein ParE
MRRPIYRDSPAYAASFVNRALKAGRSLATFPMRGRIVREFGDANVREILVSRALAFSFEPLAFELLSISHEQRAMNCVSLEHPLKYPILRS